MKAFFVLWTTQALVGVVAFAAVLKVSAELVVGLAVVPLLWLGSV